MKKLSKQYKKIIEEVNKIDQDAACYLKYVAPYHEEFEDCSVLDGCFLYNKTPQGFDYWYEIRNMLSCVYP